MSDEMFLDRKAFAVLKAAIDNPPEPNEKLKALMTNTPSPDEDRELIERLGLHRTWRDSHGELNDAPNLARARIESLLSDRATLELQVQELLTRYP